VSMKKAKGKGKTTAKKSAKKSAPNTKKPVDMVRVRENINNLVGASAKDIATEVIKVAKTGQLASAKYLFEAVGLYPPTEQTAVSPVDHSLAHTLLTRMGLPLEPVVCDEEPTPVVLISVAKSAPSIAQEDPEGEPAEEPAALPVESEE
jgi:hypothetical protein